MSKTRMGKRVASLLLSLVMMLSLLPTTVYATGDTGETTDEIVGQATTSGDNTEGIGKSEPTGEGEDGSANVTEGEDGAATNDAVVEETIAPVNAEGVDAVANAESSGDEVSGEDGSEAGNKAEVSATYVAQVDGAQYETLEAAIAAAQDGQTVTLLAEVNLTSAQTISKQLTIELNGKTISSTAYQTIKLNSGADLTVKDSAGGGKIANNYSGNAYPRTVYLNGAGAALTLESGTIESNPNLTSLQSVAISSENKRACTVNIKGGSVVVPEAATQGRSIVASTESMTLNISGGTITGGLHGVDAYSGSTVNITGGTITAHVVDTGRIEEAYGMRLIGTANVTVAGGTITGVKMDDSGYKGDVPTVKLKSGTIKGSFYSISKGTIIFDVAENADIVLENNSAEKFLPDTVKLVQNADGTYGIKAGTYVAQIGDTKYETLKEAINAANTDDTITLLVDVDLGSSKIGFYKTGCENLTFDLNGHKITSAIQNNGTVVASKVGLVIKNGTIENTCTDTKAKDATSAVYVTSGGTTTLENVTLHSNYSGLYVCQLSNAVTVVVNVEEDTVISGGKYGVDLDAPKGAATTAPGVTLNVNGGTITGTKDGIYANSPGSGKYGTINANITAGTVGGVRVVSNNTKQPVKLDITGGTINGELYNLGSTVTISGGTFAIKPDTTYLAKGYTITENADNTYGVKKTTYVAEVNGTQYESLQAAINAATRNQTVKLLADTKENVTISTPYLTLDLNGFTLNGSTGERKPALTITARVTVKDSSEGQTGTIMREDTAENSGVSSHYVIDIQGAGWLTFESGNVKNDSGAGGTKGASLVRVGDDSVDKYPGLNIKGGTFTQNNFIVIKVDSGDLFLNGGTLSSKNSYAIENWHRATVKGGTVNGDVSSWTYSGGQNSDLSIEGGTVNGNVESVSYDGAEGKLAKVKITGGTVNGTLSTKRYDNVTAPSKGMATIEITGGTFSSDPTKYVVEDSAVTPNADGTFGVEKAYLATVGETSYYTMDEAFKAQTASGEAIALLRDYTTGSPFHSGTVARTVDLNGHTWTCTGTDANSAAFEINNPNASLTVKNGKIVSSQLVGLIPSAMGGTITYDNSSLTFENVEMSTTATSGIETNGNNENDAVTLKDSTLDVPNGFGIYFPSSGTLTIDNSKINAKTMGVQVCAGSLSINAGSAITVTGDAVSKTENDGAIQDGAAVSIVNRPGYKGLDKIEVTDGKFTAKTGNAAIKAYNWANNTESDWAEAGNNINVSGGTFSSAVPEGLCAPGYVPTAVDADGNYTVEQKKVAEYNGTKYTSLQEAIDAASRKNGGQTEVKLLCDLTITETVVFAKEFPAGSVLLNLGGYTLTGNDCRALQINKGSLYLENGTVTSTGIINSSSVIRIGSNEATYNGATPMLYMQKDAKVVAPESYGVTIFGSATRGEKLKVMSNAEIIATGLSPAISGNGGANYNTDDRTSGWKAEEIIIGENAVISAANNYAIYHPECGTLNIQGGTITGTGGIQMCSGTLKISNSPKITANGSADYDYTGDAGVVYDAAAISVINRGYPQGPATVTIKGTPMVTAANGEVIHAFTWSNSNKTDGEWAEAGDKINVSGGTYSKTFNEAYLAADCTLVAGENGTYTVEQKPVAEYNGTQYTSLALAVRAANETGGTVKLLDNVTLTDSLGIGGAVKVTLDLSKKTLTLDGAQIYTQGSAAVIINSGTIKRIDTPTSGSANNFAIQVMSGSNLILGAGTGSTYKVTLESTYGIYNVGGTLTVRYADITTDGWSIAVSDSASKTGEVYIGRGMNSNAKTVITSKSGNCIGTEVNKKPNVTIDFGTLTSNGTAWDAGVVYWASEGTLTITGGTFTASSAKGSEAAAVYQKNGTVKISGTTAKLLGSTALVVKSGEGSTGTMVTELSGGTYSTKPDEAWVVEGKEIHEVDGLYKVEGPYVVEVTFEDGTVTKYDSWFSAFTNGTAQYKNATVKLLKDIETTTLVSTYANVTIDFNGHTLAVSSSNENDVAAITALAKGTAANVTLMDSVGNGGMKTTGVYGVTVRGTGATATVKSGSYNCDTSVVQVENGTAYIEGGTFQTEAADKSHLLNCIDEAFKDGTAKIEVTGGTFVGFDPSANHEGEGTTYVKTGYVSTNNGNGTYTVKEANIAIQVTSRIKDDGVTTVSTTTGGGMYCEGEKVTVTTSNVVGFKFLGWYEKDSYTTPLSADLSYTFTASKNCTLVALYSPAENATLTVKVTASAFRITGSRLEQNNGGMYKLPVGSSVTVTYTDDTYTFLYWVNGSDKIVSTSPEYTFTLGSNTELRACTSPKNTSNDNAMVVFKTAYDQVLTAKRYGNDEEIVFPMGPSKTGYKFIGWSMTQAEIRAAMAENDYIVVTPKYETLGTKYTVTVKYEGIEKVADTHTINVGDSILLTAAETVGEKTFSYWMIDDQIVSYLTTLTVFESKDVTVTAVYGVEANAEAKIRITDTTAVMNGQKYQLVFTQAYALPENATLISTGFIRATDESAAANLTLEHFAYQYVSKHTENEGVYELRLNRTSSSEVIYVRAYVQYTDADGKLQTSYSDVVHASYDILTKGGNN